VSINQRGSIFASRGRWRLVLKPRDQERWPGGNDVTLERMATDALGDERWYCIATWYLSPRERPWEVKPSEAAEIALLMAITTSDVEVKL
jgi:hypothetical protein